MTHIRWTDWAFALAIAAAVSLGGCSIIPAPAPSSSASEHFTAAAGAADSAAEAASQAATGASIAGAKRIAQVRANIDAATSAVDHDEKPVAQGELSVAQGRLSDVAPDPDEQAEADRRRALVLSGKLDQATATYQSAQAQAATQAAEVSRLQRVVAEKDAAAAVARSAAAAERERLLADAAKVRADYEHRLKAASEAARNAVLRDQVRHLNRAAFIGLTVAALSLGLGWGFGGIASLRRVGPIAILAVLGAIGCLGAAQVISKPWFLPALGVFVAASLTAIGIWAYRHFSASDLNKAVAQVAKDVRPVLDNAYETADEATRKWLDEHVFEPIGVAMDKSTAATGVDTKATVHLLRAST